MPNTIQHPLAPPCRPAAPVRPGRATPAPTTTVAPEPAVEDIDRTTPWPMHRIRWGLSFAPAGEAPRRR